MLYILAGRNFMSIDFTGGENPKKDCPSEPKKLKNQKNSKFSNFLGPKSSISLFNIFSLLIYIFSDS